MPDTPWQQVSRRHILSGTVGIATASTALTSLSLSLHVGTPIVSKQVSQSYSRKLGAYEITAAMVPIHGSRKSGGTHHDISTSP